MSEPKTPMRIAGALAGQFINSKLTPLFIAFSLLLGAFAILRTPREEEPQIVVPMLDVFVQMPGASAAEVEQRASIPMERLLREVPGVEYVYSISRPGMSMLVVRFYVGTKEEDAIIKAYNKLYSNFDRIPQGVSQPIIKVRSIDDVPIFAVTLWGKNYDSYQLRQIAGELDNQLKQIDDVSETKIIGGLPRQVRVTLDTAKLAAYGMTPGAVVTQLEGANSRSDSGSFSRGNQEFAVEAGRFLGTAADLQQIVVGVHAGHPVYLRDVASSIADGPSEPEDYVLYANGAGSKTGVTADYPAVTITLAKRKGTNATDISLAAEKKIESLRGYLLPNDLNVTLTRNYGETAKDKSDELLKHLAIATLSVTLLIALALGWRESGVVLIAIPVTLALTLFIFYLFGYTLNRVTLFALIFSIGILVDDAIVVVENIVRHFRMPSNCGRNLSAIAIEAVDEVGNPTILATFTVIAAILPMAFVRGLMGPYMRPIPVGASAAMLFSLVVAFVVSPWSAMRLLHHYADRAGEEHEKEGWTTKLYRRIMNPLLDSASRRWMFLGGVVVLLLLACSLVAFKLVKVKMLPFDNKSEFQVIVDMPNGTPLEQTTRVAQELGQYLGKQPEVVNYQIYSGTSGPYNFNGLVRHYFLRRGSNQADIQVNLLNRHERSTQSHEIAKRLRPGLGGDWEQVRRAAESGRGAARTSGAGDAGGRGLWARLPAADGAGQADQEGIRDHARRGGCRLVRGGSAGQVQRRGRSRQGSAERRIGGRSNPDRADGIERRDRGTAARSEIARGRAHPRATRPAGAFVDRVADLDAVADGGRRTGVHRRGVERQERNHRRKPLRQEHAAGGVRAGRCCG